MRMLEEEYGSRCVSYGSVCHFSKVLKGHTSVFCDHRGRAGTYVGHEYLLLTDPMEPVKLHGKNIQRTPEHKTHKKLVLKWDEHQTENKAGPQSTGWVAWGRQVATEVRWAKRGRSILYCRHIKCQVLSCKVPTSSQNGKETAGIGEQRVGLVSWATDLGLWGALGDCRWRSDRISLVFTTLFTACDPP